MSFLLLGVAARWNDCERPAIELQPYESRSFLACALAGIEMGAEPSCDLIIRTQHQYLPVVITIGQRKLVLLKRRAKTGAGEFVASDMDAFNSTVAFSRTDA